MPPLLQMKNITKYFPGVLALDNVSIDLNAGEVLCLVGENGAGKSTLMKILSGSIKKNYGEILIKGEKADLQNPADAIKLGIGIVYQDFKLVPELTVTDNIFLGSEIKKKGSSFINKKMMNELAEEALSNLGESFDVTISTSKLSVAHRQIIEIAKAINKDVKILVMDEPTAPLTDSEIKNLFKAITALQAKGVGIIYISHRLKEVFEIGDWVTIMRDGKVIKTSEVKNINTNELIKAMVGREISSIFPEHKSSAGKEILTIKNLSNEKLQNINLTLHQGEVLGLAGLVGAGRSELANIIFGADKYNEGEIFLYGKKQKYKSPSDAIKAGIAFLTEDRNLLGLFMDLSVRENISISNFNNLLSGPFIKKNKEKKEIIKYFDQLKIKAPSTETKVENLSGGNRQKVILARWLHTKSKVIIFDEPTIGIDIGVKFEFYNLINQLVDEGIGVIVISSELPELIGISDRIAVMCEGRITGILSSEEANQEKILTLATQTKIGKNAG